MSIKQNLNSFLLQSSVSECRRRMECENVWFWRMW